MDECTSFKKEMQNRPIVCTHFADATFVQWSGDLLLPFPLFWLLQNIGQNEEKKNINEPKIGQKFGPKRKPIEQEQEYKIYLGFGLQHFSKNLPKFDQGTFGLKQAKLEKKFIPDKYLRNRTAPPIPLYTMVIFFGFWPSTRKQPIQEGDMPFENSKYPLKSGFYNFMKIQNYF